LAIPAERAGETFDKLLGSKQLTGAAYRRTPANQLQWL
jgi:hypothetical protein